MIRSHRTYIQLLILLVLSLSFVVALNWFLVEPSPEPLMMSLATFGTLLSELIRYSHKR
jgi:hypothetical protein